MMNEDREIRCRAYVEELIHRLTLGDLQASIPPGAHVLFVDGADPAYTAWSLALADELQTEGRTVVLLDAQTWETRAPARCSA